MSPTEYTLLAELLSTKHDAARETEAIAILDAHPKLALLEWPGADSADDSFIPGSTALHYAANDGKQRLIQRLLACGADANASSAHWFRSVLSWASNNAQLEAIQLLLDRGAKADSLDALHAAAWGGSSRGKGKERAYAEAIKLLVGAGADVNDRRHRNHRTPLAVALESGNVGATEVLRSLGAAEE